MLIDKRPYDDREVDVNGTARRLYMGGILGGGTSLYGGALVRPSEQDFQPGKYYGKRIPRAIWDWPISYADLEPYYTEAERLYGVAGRGEEDFAPLQKPAVGYPGDPSAAPSPQPKADRRQSTSTACIRFVCRWRSTPLAACAAAFARATSVPRARAAPRLSCSSERSLKASASKSKLKSKWSDLVAERGSGATLISVLDRTSGRRSSYRARRYALGAGAIGSSLLLLRSGLGQSAGRQKLHDAPVLNRRRHLFSCEQYGVVFCQTGRLRRFLFRHARTTRTKWASCNRFRYPARS